MPSLPLLVFALLSAAASAAFTPTIVDHGTPYVLKTYNTTTLYGIPAPGYKDDILLLDLRAPTRYDMGYHYGRLLAYESLANWNALIAYINLTRLEVEIIVNFLQFEWNAYLSVQVPSDFKEELRGLGDGGTAAGLSNLSSLVANAITLGNFPGDVSNDIEWLLINQLEPHSILLRAQAEGLPSDSVHSLALHLTARLSRARMHCSMLGAWGSRTVAGDLYSMRNLDWAANTGLARYKLVTVFHPPSAIAHVTFGFAGLYGALTGMSAEGITVHETGVDSRKETFDGFPWVLRLRFIMEHAVDLASAQALWEATNNTLGMNHGIGAARDNRFLALETRAGHTAYFGAMDPREAAYEINGTKYGAPLRDAVWRTNHAYDPDIVSYEMDRKPDGDSVTRYFLLHDALVAYGTNNAIGPLEAVNLTAIVGDKGASTRESFLSCAQAAGGINILSVTYHPGSLTAYAAFEEGRDAQHVPACCGSYVRMDLSQWLKD